MPSARAAVVALVVLALAGCTGPKQVPAASPTGDVHAQVAAFLDGDLDRYMLHVSSRYADIHGEAGDPADRSAVEAHLADRFASPEHDDRYGGWSPDTAFDFAEIQLLAPVDAPPEGTGQGFSPIPGDVLVIVPPTEGSPFFDPWSGWYRAEDTQWRQVAGD